MIEILLLTKRIETDSLMLQNPAIDFKKENYDLYIDVGLDYLIPF